MNLSFLQKHKNYTLEKRIVYTDKNEDKLRGSQGTSLD